ncbi:hypothetical protein CFP56_036785 [Quercus suber]|uniref:Uncharacterized protein n=1 Tax=Quercus suber TaxID=58331 RepID=A0AAW0M9T4_QUESU
MKSRHKSFHPVYIGGLIAALYLELWLLPISNAVHEKIGIYELKNGNFSAKFTIGVHPLSPLLFLTKMAIGCVVLGLM